MRLQRYGARYSGGHTYAFVAANFHAACEKAEHYAEANERVLLAVTCLTADRKEVCHV